ncbi:hypothetical protein ATANTOWER_032320, partial [Ataeniobius toweri]|nr:hypothetical protein [Ataeniobius toweri]
MEADEELERMMMSLSPSKLIHQDVGEEKNLKRVTQPIHPQVQQGSEVVGVSMAK